jgi:hypothetical protein
MKPFLLNGPDRGFHRAFGVNGFRPHGKSHVPRLRDIAAAGIDYQAYRAAYAERGGQQSSVGYSTAYGNAPGTHGVTGNVYF